MVAMLLGYLARSGDSAAALAEEDYTEKLKKWARTSQERRCHEDLV